MDISIGLIRPTSTFDVKTSFSSRLSTTKTVHTRAFIHTFEDDVFTSKELADCTRPADSIGGQEDYSMLFRGSQYIGSMQTDTLVTKIDVIHQSFCAALYFVISLYFRFILYTSLVPIHQSFCPASCLFREFVYCIFNLSCPFPMPHGSLYQSDL